MNDPFRRTDDAGVITVTFTRDEKLNAVSEAMLDGLRLAANDLDHDPAQRVLLITAEGRYFTAGVDIGELSGSSASGVALRSNYRKLHTLFDYFETIEKPVILAAQGPCLGIGVEMASSCDFRFGASSAHFGLPELVNLAVLPGSGGISRLTRLVGPHWSRWLALACENIDAAQALQIGFLHKVIPDDEFHTEVANFAHRLVQLSAEALGSGKLAIDAAADGDRVTARNVDRLVNTQLIQSAEHQARVAEFTSRSRGSR